MRAFAVFEGGGAKGLAHIGALKAAEQAGLTFVGVAGTSAGAVAATLIAAGFRAQQLFDPQNPNSILYAKPYDDFFDAGVAEALKRLRKDVDNRLVRGGNLCQLYSLYRRYTPLIDSLIKAHGLFDTHKFELWFDELISTQLQKAHPTFANFTEYARKRSWLPSYLKIIATDYRKSDIKLFGTTETPDVVVSKAVAASIAIPFFFRPVVVQGTPLVDGGLVSNFPAWVFDQERRDHQFANVPTFGFKLVDKKGGRKTQVSGFRKAIAPEAPAADPPDSSALEAATLVTFIMQILSSALGGNTYIHVRHVPDMSIVPIPVSAGTLSFDSRKDVTYHEGFHKVAQYFGVYAWPLSDKKAGDLLHIFATSLSAVIWDAIQLHRAVGTCPQGLEHIQRAKDIHLRANIIRPIVTHLGLDGRPSEEILRIVHTHNMQDDADDKLDFRPGVGAAGRCYLQKAPVLCDLVEARETFSSHWGMKKDQQKLVRETLRALVCVPIPSRRRDHDEVLEPPTRDVLGILGFDSDDPILSILGENGVQEELTLCATLVSDYMRRAEYEREEGSEGPDGSDLGEAGLGAG